MTLAVDLSVEDPAWTAIADLEGLTRVALAAALAEAAIEADEAEVSCLFCDDATMRALNARWRGQDKATNVLSFPNGARGAGAVRLLGDIVLAYGTIAREAHEEQRPVEAHVAHLLIHGLLHLLGHDHEAPEEAEVMEALETRIMGRLGRPDPHADRPVRDAP